MIKLAEILAHSSSEEISRFCLGCLKNTNSMRFLQDDTKETKQIIKVLTNILNLQTCDPFTCGPLYLCILCEQKAISSHDFIEQCKEIHNFFLQHAGALSGKQSSECKIESEIDDEKDVTEDFKEFKSTFICYHCQESFCEKNELELHLNSHTNTHLSAEELVKVEINFRSDVNKDIGNLIGQSNEKDSIVHSRQQTGIQKLRLKQYSSEEVNAAIKMVRDKFPKHVNCCFCRFSANSPRSLSGHISRVHREYRGQWCFFCNEVVSDLLSHRKQMHDAELKCPLCCRLFKNVGHFKEHMACHSGSTRTYKCPKCPSAFASSRHLRCHWRRHDKCKALRHFSCKLCKMKFLTFKALRRHVCGGNRWNISNVILTTSDNSHETDETKSEIILDNKKEDIVEDHVAMLLSDTSKEPQNYCKICRKKVRSVTIHNYKCHPSEPCSPDDRKVLCPHCGKLFATCKLNVHMRVHTGEAPYKCQYCDRKLKTQNSLIGHERTHTGEKPYVCTQCGKAFSQSSSLKTHLKIHTGRPEHCSICEKRFCRPIELKLHMRTHTGEKPYPCTQCDVRFKQRSHLMEHMRRLHCEERPFQCEYCQKAFKDGTTLKCHLLQHTGEKPFKCSQCSYACRQAYSLTQHMRQHDHDKPQADQPHVCQVCHKSFVTLAHLNTHYNRYHSEKLEVKQ